MYHVASGRYIGLGPATNGDFGIVTLNVTTGRQELFTPLQLPFSNDNSPMNLQLDQDTGDLYAFNQASSTDDPSGGTAGVYRITLPKGETTLAASAPHNEWTLVQGLSTFDSKTHTYVTWGKNEVGGGALWVWHGCAVVVLRKRFGTVW